MTPLLLALALVTQSTDIEREAAAGILRQIDSLEARLKPTENAQRLVTRNDAARDRVLASVTTAWNGELQGLSDWIGHHPEVGWHEFQAFDTLIRSHSSVETRRDRPGFGVCCLNIDAVKYTFTGRPAHQLTAWNGRNALEAAVQFYSAVDHLRSTWRSDHRVQGVIPEGGIAPNVVPDHTVVDYFIRFPDEVYLEHIARMMDDAAKGAAQMTETDVEITRYGEYRDGITVSALEELFFAYAKKFGAPGLQDEKGRPAGYEETGWVSREIPGVGVTVRSSSFANHTYGLRDDPFADIGHKSFLLDGQLEAAVLFDFLTRPELRAAVTEEHRTLAGLQGQYLAALRRVYAPEIGADTALSKESRAELRIPQVKRP